MKMCRITQARFANGVIRNFHETIIKFVDVIQQQSVILLKLKETS